MWLDDSDSNDDWSWMDSGTNSYDPSWDNISLDSLLGTQVDDHFTDTSWLNDTWLNDVLGSADLPFDQLFLDNPDAINGVLYPDDGAAEQAATGLMYPEEVTNDELFDIWAENDPGALDLESLLPSDTGNDQGGLGVDYGLGSSSPYTPGLKAPPTGLSGADPTNPDGVDYSLVSGSGRNPLEGLKVPAENPEDYQIGSYDYGLAPSNTSKGPGLKPPATDNYLRPIGRPEDNTGLGLKPPTPVDQNGRPIIPKDPGVTVPGPNPMNPLNPPGGSVPNAPGAPKPSTPAPTQPAKPTTPNGQNPLTNILMALLAAQMAKGNQTQAVVPTTQAFAAAQKKARDKLDTADDRRQQSYFTPIKAARGGVMPGGNTGGISSLGAYAAGGKGRLVAGKGDGVSDHVPATIDGVQPARIARGEYVIPARVVAELGNGSTDAGAERLDAMVTQIEKSGRKAGRGQDSKAHRHLLKG